MRIPRIAWLLVVSALWASTVPGAVAVPGSPRTREPYVPFDLATEYPQPEPVLHAAYADPDGDRGQVLYSIYAPDGAVVMKDVAGPLVPSGSDSPFTVPPGTLQDGVLYSWTARSFDGSRYSAPTTAPNFVGTGGEGISAHSINPWGCWVEALWPHRSTHYPGYIVAEGRTRCQSIVPQGSDRIEHAQWLYRSSWRGWILVGSNDSICDRGAYTAGQSPPSCDPNWFDPRMTAWVRWNCVAAGFKGGWYNYLQVDKSRINYGGTTYYADDTAQTGAWNEPGNTLCY